MSGPGVLMWPTGIQATLEAFVQGWRNALLDEQQYETLCQADTLDDLKQLLSGFDYGNFLQNDQILTAELIRTRLDDYIAAQFNDIRGQADHPLSEFMDYITYQYMLTNVLKLLKAQANHRSYAEVRAKCHKLGIFPDMEALAGADTAQDMYEQVLYRSPLAKFFELSKEATKDFDEYAITYIQEALLRKYMESFYDFCRDQGGVTAEVMCEILEFEADWKVITNTHLGMTRDDLDKEDKLRLYPNFGQLVDFHEKFAEVKDEADLKGKIALAGIPVFRQIYEEEGTGQAGATSSSKESTFTKRLIELHKSSINRQCHLGVFYSWWRLKEIEVQNISWIASCIEQQRKHRVGEYYRIF